MVEGGAFLAIGFMSACKNGVEGRGEGETDAGDIKEQGVGSHMMLTSLSFPKIGKKEKK